MISVSKITGVALRSDSKLTDEIRALAVQSYEDPTAILKREFDECTTAYLGRDERRELVCFYLTSWGNLFINGQTCAAVHLGLSATRQDTKNSGLISSLYSPDIADAVAWERREKQKLLLWSTTASLTVYLAVSRYLSNAEPGINGEYSDFGASAAAAIRRFLKASFACDDNHPIVLKGITEGTNYSEDERRRIAEDDERDIGRVKIGQKAQIIADAYQEVIVTGRISSIGDTMGRKKTTTGNPSEKSDRDVLDVIIELDNTDLRLVIGLRVTARFLSG